MKLCLGALLAAVGAAFGGYLHSVRPSAKAATTQHFAGITPIYRQLSPRERGTPVRPAAWSLAAESVGSMPAMIRIEEIPDSDGLAEYSDGHYAAAGRMLRLASPRVPSGVERYSSIGRVSSTRRFDDASALVFQSSFAALFANLFDTGNVGQARQSSPLDEESNPFTEAKAQETAGEVNKGAQESVSEHATSSSDHAPAAQEESGAAGAGAKAPLESFIFLGNTDGSGQLGTVEAHRTGSALFSFEDGDRAFRISVNPSAVEYQRSFAVDDIDGDGIPDLVVTSRASLMGAALLGDGTGEFRLDGSFLTGFEPTVATVGPMRDGRREILSLDLRTGVTTAFRRQGHYYVQSRMNQLDMLPDYIGYVAGIADGSDNLLAAQAGQQPRIYRWLDDDRFVSLSESLPAEPTLDLSPDVGRRAGIAGLRVYQVGPYASVMLTDASGRAFNVANLRVSPNIFLVFGNLDGRGTLDVGVAWLLPQAASR